MKPNVTGMDVIMRYWRANATGEAYFFTVHLVERCVVKWWLWRTVKCWASQETVQPNLPYYIRIEITTALKRNDVRVIPVLVEGVRCPSPPAPPPGSAVWC